MKPSQLNDRQKRMILNYELPDSVLGERFGMSKSSVRQVRVQLKAALPCDTSHPVADGPVVAPAPLQEV